MSGDFVLTLCLNADHNFFLPPFLHTTATIKLLQRRNVYERRKLGRGFFASPRRCREAAGRAGPRRAKLSFFGFRTVANCRVPSKQNSPPALLTFQRRFVARRAV